MSVIVFTCSNCQQALRVVGETAGKKTKCVKCGTVLAIPLAPTAPVPPQGNVAMMEDVVADEREPSNGSPLDNDSRARARDDDRPRRRARDDEDDDDNRPRRRAREDDYDDRPRRRARDDEDDYDDRPRRRAREDDEDDYDDRPRKNAKPAWNVVQVGLVMEIVTAVMLMAYAGLMVAFMLILLVGAMARSLEILELAVYCGIFGMAIYGLLQIPAVVGYVLSLFAPNKKGTLVFGILTLVAGSASLIIKIIFVVLPLFSRTEAPGPEPVPAKLNPKARGAPPPQPPPAPAGPKANPLALAPSVGVANRGALVMLTVLFLALMDVEYLLFPQFLRSIARIKKNQHLIEDASLPFTLACVYAGLKLVLMGIVVGMGARMPGGIGFIVYVFLLLMFAFLIFFGKVYLSYLGRVKGAISAGD